MTTAIAEIIYGHALAAIASGSTRGETLRWIGNRYSALNVERTLSPILADALDGALQCGVEREDIDPSWF